MIMLYTVLGLDKQWETQWTCLDIKSIWVRKTDMKKKTTIYQVIKTCNLINCDN